MNRVERTLQQSSVDFLAHVWPAIKNKLGGGSVDPVEAVTDEGATRNLDMLAGIDVWHYLHDNGGMRGIASRVQWLYPDNPKWADRWPWRTFTVRQHTRAGGVTEYEKRLAAIHGRRGLLFPSLTVQAYLREKGSGPLDAAAIVWTEDLIRHIDEHGGRSIACSDGQVMLSVSWGYMIRAGVRVEVIDTPTEEAV